MGEGLDGAGKAQSVDCTFYGAELKLITSMHSDNALRHIKILTTL